MLFYYVVYDVIGFVWIDVVGIYQEEVGVFVLYQVGGQLYVVLVWDGIGIDYVG